MTIIVDDAGSGDLLFGIIIGAYRQETAEFKYDVIDVKFFQPDAYCDKGYLSEAARITDQLLAGLQAKPDEPVQLCQGYIFDTAAQQLKERLGDEEQAAKQIQRIRVVGEAQRLTEIAYLDEIRNLGYEPLSEREEKRAKSFFHMMRWLKEHPDMLRYAKSGWPRLKRYRLFKLAQEAEGEKATLHVASCSECGAECEVPFKPDLHRPVYCNKCWGKRRHERRANGGKHGRGVR